MDIEKTSDGTTVIVAVSGRVDAIGAPALDKELRAVGAEAEVVVLDFAGVPYVSSAGLRVILSAHKMMSRKGGLRLRNVCAGVMEVLDLTGFKDILGFE